MKPIFNIPRLELHKKDGGSVKIEVPDLSIYPGQIGLVIMEDDRARLSLMRHLAGLPHSASLEWTIDDALNEGSLCKLPESSCLGLIYENSETQFSGLFNSASSELLLPLSMAGVSVDLQEIELQRQLSAWGLTGKRDSQISDLSDGQRQRLLISSMLLAGNKLILHEGVLGYVDPIDRIRLLAYLKVISLSTNRAILFFAASVDNELRDILDFSILSSEFDITGPINIGELDMGEALNSPIQNCINSSLTVRGISWRPPNSSLVLYGGMSFSLGAGEAAIVTGPNGSGKSSLGYLLAGIEPPLSGTIEFDGILAHKRSANLCTPVSIVPADPDYVLAEEFVWKEYQRSNRSILSKKNIAALSDLLGISDFIDRNPFDLPWRLRRNVAVLRALAAAEIAVFIDEPTADLSDALVKQFIEVIKYCRHLGLIIICASNDTRLIDSAVFSRIIRIPSPCIPALANDNPASKIGEIPAIHGGLDHADEVESWKALANDWLANAGEFCLFWIRFVYPVLANSIFNSNILPSNAVLIDLGCGNGLHTRAIRSLLASKGCQISRTLGVDAVDHFISVARLDSVSENNETFLCADLRKPEVLRHIDEFIEGSDLPNIVTSFFSLHDLSSLSILKDILLNLRGPGSIFFGIIVSPDFVEEAHHIYSIPQENCQLEEVGKRDWLASCSFKVTSDSDNELSVPYFHRSAQQYVDFLEENWGPTSVHFQDLSRNQVISASDQPGCRTDGIIFLRSVSRLGG